MTQVIILISQLRCFYFNHVIKKINNNNNKLTKKKNNYHNLENKPFFNSEKIIQFNFQSIKYRMIGLGKK